MSRKPKPSFLPEYIPAELEDLTHRLKNWSRWAYERDGKGRAASAEGRYTQERGDQEERREPAPPPVDDRDAMVVGKALSPFLGFPHRWFSIIKLRYFYRARREVICRKIGCHVDNYNRELITALFGLANCLTRRAWRADNGAITAATSKERKSAPRQAQPSPHTSHRCSTPGGPPTIGDQAAGNPPHEPRPAMASEVPASGGEPSRGSGQGQHHG